jgi:hypothetical protein
VAVALVPMAMLPISRSGTLMVIFTADTSTCAVETDLFSLQLQSGYTVCHSLTCLNHIIIAL